MCRLSQVVFIGCAFHIMSTLVFYSESADTYCPFNESVYVNGRCIILVGISQDWESAKNFCENVYGGRLAELVLDDDWKQAIKLINQTQLPHEVWIALTGGTQSNQHKYFTWYYSKKIATNVPWETGEPNNAHNNEDCAEFLGTSIFDDKCYEKRDFLCDIEIHNMDPVAQHCYPWGNAASYGNKCYTMIGVEMQWQKAKTFCEKTGGHLAEPNDDFILFLKYYIAVTSVNVKEIWVGAQRTVNQVIRANNLASSSSTESCVVLNMTDTKLYAQACSGSHVFVCEQTITDPCKAMNAGLHFNGHCYSLYQQEVTWEEAMESCFGENKRLLYDNSNDAKMSLYYLLNPGGIVWIDGLTTNTDLNDYRTIGVQSFQGETASEKHKYVCVSAATESRIKEYVLVLPTVLPRTFIGQVFITSSFEKLFVLLTISQYCYELRSRTNDILLPRKSVMIVLNQCLVKSDQNLIKLFAQVTSTQPVTVILYVKSSRGHLVGSTLVLPSDMFVKAKSYFMFSALDKVLDGSVAMVSMEPDKANVNQLFDLAHVYDIYNITNVKFSLTRSYINIIATMRDFENRCVFINNYRQESYFYSNHPVSVMQASQEVPGYGGSLNDLDFTLDHLLPLEYFGSQYVSFPSPQLEPSQSNVTFKIIALHNNSNISIFGEKIEEALQLILTNVGEVVVLELSSAYFYYFNSSKNFYISLTHSLQLGNVSAKSVCTASLIPVQLWRLQYDFETMPDTVIYIVVETGFENLIEINNISKQESVLKCSSILGSNLSGCTYKVEDPNVTLYQVRIKYHQLTLSVYTYVYDQIYNTSMCTAVGLSDDYRPLNVFLDEEYINSQYNFSEDTEPPYKCKLPSTPPTPTVASLETVKQISQEIVRNLTVAKLNISSFRRTKESIKDYRPSSNAIGYSGIIMITLVFVVVCGNDVATVAINLVTWLKSLKM